MEHYSKARSSDDRALLFSTVDSPVRPAILPASICYTKSPDFDGIETKLSCISSMFRNNLTVLLYIWSGVYTDTDLGTPHAVL